MKAADFMTKKVISLDQEQSIEQAAKTMKTNKISVLPIVDKAGTLMGILTQSDLVGKEATVKEYFASIKNFLAGDFQFGDIEKMYKNAKTRKIKELMTENPICTEPDADLMNIVDLMNKKRLKRLPVVEADKVVGIITRKDIIQAFSNDKS